ncbi:adhesion G protein-coupled receptor E3-like isoform X2 [Trichomycterus rosablanca]|uniref:adhesion G protein-coupled receptor E3-like isoform X2 n=1 Tax=Trichomycterus rosablanca TaxID=2290929 RepID=UPI002F35C5A3
MNLTAKCAMDFLDQILNISAEERHQEMVEGYLNTITILMTSVMNTVTDEDDLIRFGDSVLNVNEKLASTLLRNTETFNLTSIFLQMLEVQVFQVGPAGADPYLSEVLQLQMSTVTMDIDLSEILNENNGSAAVGLISYSNMAEILKSSLFNTIADDENVLVSSVVSAVLPKTSNTQLTRAANFTFKHNTVFSITDPLYCVYWDSSRWVESGCDVTRINTTHTECSCSHLSTFALIVQNRYMPSGIGFLELCTIVGMVCLGLSLLTFTVCRDPKRNKTALINLSLNILIRNLYYEMPYSFFKLIYSDRLLRAVIAGVIDCLNFSFFVWMFLEAVVLYILVRNLSKIGSGQRKVPNWKWLMLIGHGTSLSLTVVSSSCKYVIRCTREVFIFTFIYPICVLNTMSTVLVIVLIIHLINTLIQLKNNSQQMNNTVDKKLMISVGTFIFLVHCVFNQKVREKYKQILGACFHYLTSKITRRV